LPVSDEPAAPMAKNGIFFSFDHGVIARLTPVLEPPRIMVRPFWSAPRAPSAHDVGCSGGRRTKVDRLAEDRAAEVGDRHLDHFDAVRPSTSA